MADADDSLGNRGEKILQILEETKSFTKQLLTENEALRYRVAAAQERVAELERQITGTRTTGAQGIEEALGREVEQLRVKLQGLESRYAEIEEENVDFARKYIEVEQQNNNLANLYIASYQLHASLQFDHVVRTVMEIIVNLIGADEFAIYLLRENKATLEVIASEGESGTLRRHVPVGVGIVGRVAESGSADIANPEEIEERLKTGEPIAAIPLMIESQTIGVIAIKRLLTQKNKVFTDIDMELFSLLGGHAATALYSATLYTKVERKLQTIEGFMGLLKPEGLGEATRLTDGSAKGR
ncbi:MAG: GAF domain-containing protein [Acidobacteriota bacterium]